MHTLWDNCCTRFEDTQFECGLRPLRPFGPGTIVARSSNVARGSKRTRFAASRLSLPNQPKDNVTPMHTLWDNCCTRFEDTQFECGLRPLRRLENMYVALYSGYIGHNLNIISLIVMTVGVISIVKNEYCNITFEIFLAQTWIYNAKTL